MAVHEKSEAGPEEEAGSSIAWAVPHQATSNGYVFRVIVT